MKCTGFEPESYAFYVLGTADSDVAGQIGNHLAMGCETCGGEIAAYESLWGEVALTAPAAAAPSSLRAKILDRIEEKPKTTWRMFWIPALAGGLAVAAISMVVIPITASRKILPNIVYSPHIVVNSEASSMPAPTPTAARVAVKEVAPPERDDSLLQTLRAELTAEREKTAQLEAQLRVPRATPPSQPQTPPTAIPAVENTAELQRLRERVTSLEHQVAQYQTLLEIERRRADRTTQIAGMVTSPQLKVVPLKGTERVPGAVGHVLISGSAQMIFVASGLPAPPPRRTYQLWIIRSDRPAIASGGTFDPDRDNRATLQFSNPSLLKNVTAFAVTDEPAGGSQQPTGQKWLIGL